jgi:integrase
MAKGWIRRKKGSLVYCWIAEEAATGERKERSKVVGPDTMSDADGWETVGALKQQGKISMSATAVPGKITFSDLTAWYLANKAFKKQSTEDLHRQIVGGLLAPRWGARSFAEIKPVEIKRWLNTLGVGETTRAKYLSVMRAVYTFAQSEGVIPLGLEYNPACYVKGFSSLSDYEAMILDPEQTYRVLERLDPPEYVLVLLIAATGMRQSEALGLRWADVQWEKGEIKIRQTYVHGCIQVGAKTRLSKSCVELHPLLAAMLKAWSEQTLYGNPEDYIFASHKLRGKKPRVGSMIVEDYLRPAAIQAGVIIARNGKTFDGDGNEIKRFGFHTLRHSLCSFLMAEGQNPAVIQATLRHRRLDMTMHYAHSSKKQKLEAQGLMLEAVLGSEREPKREPQTIQ